MNETIGENSDETVGLLNGSYAKRHVQYNSVIDDRTENEEDGVTIITRKYWYRWYICFIFAFMGLLQGAVWNTWSPIDESAECALGFTSGDIALLTNWGPISFLVCMPGFMWMLHRKGLRIPVVITAFLVSLGTGLRCLPLPLPILRYIIHTGQMFNGIAGCVVMAAPTLLSNVWFPPAERVTATSITTLFNYFGTGFGYMIGPLMVQQPSKNSTHNTSDVYQYLDYVMNQSGECNNTHQNEIMRGEIKNLMYLEFGLTTAVFICMLVFFPAKPPYPPSASASAERMDFKDGLKALLKRRTFLIVVLTFSLTIGSYGGWTGVLSVILNPLHISQDEAGRLGFVMTIVGCAVGMVVGWFADRFKGHMKLMIVVLLTICFFSFFYYIIMSQGWINVKGFEFSRVGLWIVCIIIGIAMNAAVPLSMEMAADAAYPTSEAVSTSVLVWCLNVLNFILILVLEFSDPAFTNYLMLGFIAASIPLLVFFASEPNNRLAVDMHPETLDVKNQYKHPPLDPNVNPSEVIGTSSDTPVVNI